MTAIGIDLQPSCLQIALDERRGSPRPISVGPGAVLSLFSGRPGADAVWPMLRSRLAGHLGVDGANLPPVVLACGQELGATAANAMVRAGWRKPTVLSPATALTAVAAQAEGEALERWVAVAAGEDSLEARGFVLDRASRSARVFQPRRANGVGHAAIARRACREAGLKGEMDALWSDAALEFAEEIEQVGERAVRWRGPVSDALRRPMTTLREVREWSEFKDAEAALLLLAQAASADTGGPCRIVLGGIAAAWPLGRSLASGWADGLLAGRALVATGAAATGAGRLNVGGWEPRDELPSEAAPSVQDSRSSAPLAEMPLPPWKRHSTRKAGS